MQNEPHPFAGGSGGHRFEHRIGAWLAGEMLLHRMSVFGGTITHIRFQTGPLGFDDQQLTVEAQGSREIRVHAQCRSTQTFVKSNRKFVELLNRAIETVRLDQPSFSRGDRRLAIIVGGNSPGHSEMGALCRLARKCQTLPEFKDSIRRHQGKIARRWDHCREAVGGTDEELVHRTLQALWIYALDVAEAESGDWNDLVNRLGQMWEPADYNAAVRLASALSDHVASLNMGSGSMDVASLHRDLGSYITGSLGNYTRRESLQRAKLAEIDHMRATLVLIGLDKPSALLLTNLAFQASPDIDESTELAVIVGAMGVGKSTELQRLHCRAIDRALDDITAPIPLKCHASDVLSGQLPLLIQTAARTIGDPNIIGVHLVIDGCDETSTPFGEILSRVRLAVALYPNSRIFLASRPQPFPEGLRQINVQPLSKDAAQRLMEFIHPQMALRMFRSQVVEVLCRPLFAIRYALDARQNKHYPMSEAELINSVGTSALQNAGVNDPRKFNILTMIATKIMDSGLAAIDLRALSLTVFEEEELARSRLLNITNRKVRFQLASLTEWFAASALVKDSEKWSSVLGDPLVAYRWRYALVQAISRAPFEQGDEMILSMLERIPAIGAWVLSQVDSGREPSEDSQLESPLEAGARIRRALQGWLTPWPILAQLEAPNGELPPLGISVRDRFLNTVWLSSESVGAPVFLLPQDLGPAKLDQMEWSRSESGTASGDFLWPWSWTKRYVFKLIGELMGTLALAAEVPECWAELAWVYAGHVLDVGTDLRREPIRVVDLEKRVSELASEFPGVDVLVGPQRTQWLLSDAQAFLRDLTRLGVSEIAPPWPTPDRRGGGWIWDYWSDAALLDRVRAVSRVALDIYKKIIDRHLPSMAIHLSTYQMLPGRIVGEIQAAKPEVPIGGPILSWHLEPLPAGSFNECKWELIDSSEAPRERVDSWQVFEARQHEVEDRIKTARGDRSELINIAFHNDFSGDIFRDAPAASFALGLIRKELAAFGWLKNQSRSTTSGSVRPRSR